MLITDENSDNVMRTINEVNNLLLTVKSMEENINLHKLLGSLIYKYLVIKSKVTMEMGLPARMRAITETLDKVRELVNVDGIILKNAMSTCDANLFPNSLGYIMDKAYVYPTLPNQCQQARGTFISFINVNL